MIELVTVLAILLVISVFAMPTMELSFVRSREKLLHERLAEMRRAIDQYAASRNNTGGSVFPPSVTSLITTIPTTLLLPGANAGPFLASDSIGNPFSEGENSFFWDVRDKDGVWHPDEQDPNNVLNVFDIRYPTSGIAGWKKALDGTNYVDW